MKIITAATLATLALASVATAQPTVAPATMAKPAKVLIDLSPEEVDPSRILPPPPAAGSPRAVAEIAELHRIAASVSPARMAQAKWDDDHEDPTMFAPTLGPAYDLKTMPATAELLALVQNDASVAASSAKKLFHRPRPWVADATIKTCDPEDKPLSSYPSGHATLGYSLALTLAAAMPARAQTLMARAYDYAYSREICGAHFSSDTQASQGLASAMVATLLTKPDFQAKLQKAVAELAALPPAP